LHHTGSVTSSAARFLNIGGGPEWNEDGWINLDGALDTHQPGYFDFDTLTTPAAALPFPAARFDLVYSSHCLEHLSDATVGRLLPECARVLTAGGDLVLKIPDFTRVLDAVRSGDDAFLRDSCWSFETVSPTWAARGVADDALSRASMIFCGFWNASHGNHFARGDGRADDRLAYHGPAPMPPADVRALLRTASPHEAATTLRAFVTATETGFRFNHQNAWSAAELAAVLSTAGLDVVSFDTETIAARFGWTPGFDAMRAFSLYAWARPCR